MLKKCIDKTQNSQVKIRVGSSFDRSVTVSLYYVQKLKLTQDISSEYF